ncbi:MAG: Dabb family protein [Lachnospiraceae bacterium]|nr:Dabb family protein [Lachnospiraceae bacterium]
MVYHIVMWNFKKEITEEKKKEQKAVMAEQLKSLVGQVPGLLTVELVTDPIPSSTHEIALVTTLEKAEDVAVYANHPAHVAVADTYVRPYVCDRAALDYEPECERR